MRISTVSLVLEAVFTLAFCGSMLYVVFADGDTTKVHLIGLTAGVSAWFTAYLRGNLRDR